MVLMLVIGIWPAWILDMINRAVMHVVLRRCRMGFPILSLIIFIPLVAGLIILALPAERKLAITGHRPGGGRDRPGAVRDRLCRL